MPTPPLTLDNPNVAQALAIWDSLPEPRRASDVADRMGRPYNTVQHWLRTGWELRKQDPAIEAAKKAASTGLMPSTVWVKTGPDEGGTSYSVMLRPTQEGFIDRVAERLSDLPPAPKIRAPVRWDGDLCNLFPIFDFHLGMLAWEPESGESYSTSLAVERLSAGVASLLARAPKAETAIVLNGGDFTHANDPTAQTPKSKHNLDVDSRHWRVLEAAIDCTAHVIEMALQRHQRVIYRALPGNHDPATAAVLTIGLAQRYRDDPRVEVIRCPTEFFAHRHGATMIAAHHGDKAKADRLVMHMADEWPEMWGQTRHRYYWTGHLHHHKSADIGGVRWEQLQAVSPRDAHAASSAYAARASLSCVTYDARHGEIGRLRQPLGA